MSSLHPHQVAFELLVIVLNQGPNSIEKKIIMKIITKVQFDFFIVTFWCEVFPWWYSWWFFPQLNCAPGAQFNWKKIITKIIMKIITKVQFDFFVVTFWCEVFSWWFSWWFFSNWIGPLVFWACTCSCLSTVGRIQVLNRGTPLWRALLKCYLVPFWRLWTYELDWKGTKFHFEISGILLWSRIRTKTNYSSLSLIS